MLYGDLHVRQALALVVADEAYSEVLQLESEPRVEGQDDAQPQVHQAAAPNPVLNAAIIKAKDRHVEGGRFHLIFQNKLPTAPMHPPLYA